MKVKKKAKLFIEQLGQKIVSDKKPISSFSAKSQFIKVIQGLPDGKLKTELLNDVERYYEELFRILLEDQKSSFKQATACVQPYNLYLQSKKIDKKVLQDVDEESSYKIYSLYVSEAMNESLSVGRLKKLLKCCLPKNEESNDGAPVWLNQIRKLCAICSGRSESFILQRTMKLFHDNISEEDISLSNITRLDAMKDAVISFLKYCHIKPDPAKMFARPSYGDLISAILSVYIEMVLTTSRDKNETDQRHLAKSLCSTVLYFIEPHHHLGLEALIQVDCVIPTDGAIVGPLCRKLLEKPTGVHEPAIYTKYIVAGRMISRLLPGIVDDLVLMLNGVRAPKTYLEWLSNRNDEIISQLPVDNHFKRTKITRFLLNNASDGIIDGLLDALTEPPGEQLDEDETMDEDKAMDTDVFSRTVTSTSVDSYCFIDRSGNICLDADTVEAMETEDQGEGVSIPKISQLDDQVEKRNATNMKQLKKEESRNLAAQQEQPAADISSLKNKGRGKAFKKSGDSSESEELEVATFVFSGVDVRLDDEDVEEYESVKKKSELKSGRRENKEKCIKESDDLSVNTVDRRSSRLSSETNLKKYKKLETDDTNEEKECSKKKKDSRKSSSNVESPLVDASGKPTTGDQFSETLGNLGEICRKGRRSKRLAESSDDRGQLSGDVISEKLSPRKNPVLLSSSFKNSDNANAEHVVMQKGHTALSDLDAEAEAGSVTLHLAVSPSKKTAYREELDDDLSNVSPKITRRGRVQQELATAGLGKIVQKCTNIQQDVTVDEPSVESPLKHKATLTVKSPPQQFDLFASLQTEDTCDSNTFSSDILLTSSQDLIAETDMEGDELKCAKTGVFSSPWKVNAQTTPILKSPNCRNPSPKSIPESPTRAAALEAKVRVVSTNRGSSGRVSDESPMKFMTPEIVEADSSFVQEPSTVPTVVAEELKVRKKSVLSNSVAKEISSPTYSVSPVFTRLKSQIAPAFVPSSQPTSPSSLAGEEFHMSSTQHDIFPSCPVGITKRIDVLSDSESDNCSLSKVISASLSKLRRSLEDDNSDWNISPVGSNTNLPKSDQKERTQPAQMAFSIPDLSKYLNNSRDWLDCRRTDCSVPTKSDVASECSHSLPSSAIKKNERRSRLGANKLSTGDTRKDSLSDAKFSSLPSSPKTLDVSRTRRSRRESLGEEVRVPTIAAESPSRVGVLSPSSQIRKTSSTAEASDKRRSSPAKQGSSASSSHSISAGVTDGLLDPRSTSGARSPLDVASSRSSTTSASKTSRSSPSKSMSNSTVANDESVAVNSVKCRLFSSKSVPMVAAVAISDHTPTDSAVVEPQLGAPVSRIPRLKQSDRTAKDEQPSCSTKSNITGRKRSFKTSSPSQTQCDSNVRRSARLISKVTTDDGLSASQTSVTSSQLCSPSTRKRVLSQSSDSPSRKRRTSEKDGLSDKRARIKD